MIQMISHDCKNCTMVDLDNPDFPCKLEETGSTLRCNILHEWVKTEGLKRELYDI